MKINLPVFKDGDAKDAVTYHSWRWDLTVYWHVRCRDHTLLTYAIQSLQGYPGEIVWSSSMDITLDDVLTYLDKHYNNVKALDTLNQELFQLPMVDKETVLDWGVCLSRHLQVLAASFPDCFPPDLVAELKRDHLYGGLPKCLKAMVAYLKVGLQVRTYSNYLREAWEAEKEDSMEFSCSPRTQATDNAPKPWPTSFFPLQKLKGNQPASKAPAVWLVHLEEEGARRDKEKGNNDSNGINGVTEEFMVHLARAVKNAQTEDKCCYHCSSPEHFICNCLLMKTLRDKPQQGGNNIKECSLDPSNNSYHTEDSPRRGFQGVKPPQQTPVFNPDPFQHWHVVRNVARVRINGESCTALLDNGVQINTIMPKYLSDHSLQMGLFTDLLGTKVTCLGLGNAYTRPLGYVVIWVQADRVQGYDGRPDSPGNPRLI